MSPFKKAEAAQADFFCITRNRYLQEPEGVSIFGSQRSTYILYLWFAVRFAAQGKNPMPSWVSKMISYYLPMQL